MTAKHERIYLDYAGATPVLPEATEVMIAAMSLYANPGAIHADGVAAKHSLARSRESIAAVLGCKAREIVFVSGGSEANNLSILGFARVIMLGKVLLPNRDQVDSLAGTHWIVSSIEHPSVLECFSEVERLGGSVSFVDPDEKGIIHPEAVAAVLRKETVFVSVGWGNGEIGTIQPLSRIAREIHSFENGNATTIIFHCDAGQAPLYDAANIHSLGVDLLSFDSGKLYGPRGIGCVYLNGRVLLSRIQLGGGQERGLRAGTENVALAAAFAEAITIISKEREKESERLSFLRRGLSHDVCSIMPGILINGDLAHTMPHMLNVSIPDISSEYLTLALDYEGISVSTKSACREGEEQESHVVRALGGEDWRSRNTLRFSLGRNTTPAELDYVALTLSNLLTGLPRKSPRLK